MEILNKEEVVEESVVGTVVSGAVFAAFATGCVILLAKKSTTKLFNKKKLNKISLSYEQNKSKFVPIEDMDRKVYRFKSTLDGLDIGTEKKGILGLCGDKYVEYSIKGKPVFSYTVKKESKIKPELGVQWKSGDGIKPIVNLKLQRSKYVMFYLNDSSYKEFESFYKAWTLEHNGMSKEESTNWINKEFKSLPKHIQESTLLEIQSLNQYMTEALSVVDIKPELINPNLKNKKCTFNNIMMQIEDVNERRALTAALKAGKPSRDDFLEFLKGKSKSEKTVRRQLLEVIDMETLHELEGYVQDFYESVMIESTDNSSNKETMSPDLKRLDEKRGKLADLQRDLEKAEEMYDKTSESLYEKKIRGLNHQIDKLEKEIKAGDLKAKKEEEKLANESALYQEATPVNMDGRINYWKQMIEGVMKKINEKIALKKNTTDMNKIASVEQEIKALNNKITEYKKHIEDLEAQKKGEPRHGIGMSGKMHSGAYAMASTDDTIYGFEPVIESVKLESADMEDEIKPIVEEFERKGYKVKYASPGHSNLRKKEDANRDGKYYGKLYSDARIMFDKKYDFPNAPKYWHLRDVDDCSYLDISPEPYDGNDADKAFSDWKYKYMESLRAYVKSLKDNSTSDVKESTNELADNIMNNIFESMGLYDTIDNSYTAIVESANESSVNLLNELDVLLNKNDEK